MGASVENRKMRRAYKSRATKYQGDLIKISQQACKYFNEDVEKTKRWLYQATAELGDLSPIECILLGKGKEVLTLLAKATEIKSSASVDVKHDSV